MKNSEERRPYLIIAAWLTGIAYTLIKGIFSDPWGVGVFDVDLISLLTGHLFLSVGSVQAAVFALGQGFLMDVFSVEPRGLSALAYMGVFCCIYLGSFYLNLQTAKGEVILISSLVMARWAIWGGILFFLHGGLVMDRSLAIRAGVSILGTGLLAPALFPLFDRLRGSSAQEEGETPLEGLKAPLAGWPFVLRRRGGSASMKRDVGPHVTDRTEARP